jgi:GMP synthase (glutamine-hydrolysing)
MLPIAILQNDESVPVGLLGDSLAARHISVELIEVFRRDSLPDLDEVSGVVILGGHMGAYEEPDHPFLVEEKKLVRLAVDLGRPLLGICLGCQIVADALGGGAYRVEPQEAGLVDLRVTATGCQDPLGSAIEGPMVSWHHDSWDLPPEGILLATSDRYPQAFRVGSAVGVQFHPEATPGILEGWIRRDAASLHEIGVDPIQFLGAVRAAEAVLGDRADRLFGAWIAEAQSTESDQ